MSKMISLAILSLLLPFVIAVGYDNPDLPVINPPEKPVTITDINGSILNTNYSLNSGQLEGRDTATLKTYLQGLYDLVYVQITDLVNYYTKTDVNSIISGNSTDISGLVPYTEANETVDLLSTELLDDASFDNCGTYWTLGNGWSCSGGSLIHGEVEGDDVTETYPLVAEVGSAYNVSCVVTDDSGSGVGITFGGQTLKIINVPETATYNKILIPTTTTGLVISNTGGGGPVTITSCSVKKYQNLIAGNVNFYGGITKLGLLNVTGNLGNPGKSWWIEAGQGDDDIIGSGGGSITIKAGDCGDSGGGLQGTCGTAYLLGGDSGSGGNDGDGGNVIVKGGKGLQAGDGGDVYVAGGDEDGVSNSFGEVYLGNGYGTNPGTYSGSVHLLQDYRKLWFGASDDAYIWWFNILNELQLVSPNVKTTGNLIVDKNLTVVNNLNVSLLGNVYFEKAGVSITSSNIIRVRYLYPSSANSYNLGYSASPWNEIWGNYLNVSKHINVTDVNVGNIIKLKSIVLPSCSSVLKNSISANTTGTYGCDGTNWVKIF